MDELKTDYRGDDPGKILREAVERSIAERAERAGSSPAAPAADLDGMEARIERGWNHVDELAEDVRRNWRMTIPANGERDSDLILADGFKAGRQAVRMLRARSQPFDYPAIARAVVEAVKPAEVIGVFAGNPHWLSAGAESRLAAAIEAAVEGER